MTNKKQLSDGERLLVILAVALASAWPAFLLVNYFFPIY